jgi:hypothetical protein
MEDDEDDLYTSQGATEQKPTATGDTAEPAPSQDAVMSDDDDSDEEDDSDDSVCCSQLLL